MVGDTQNTPAPALNFPEYITVAYSDEKSMNSGISAISVSNPTQNPIEIIGPSNNKSSKKIAETLKEYIGQSMSAVRDGADYLEAIRTAAKYSEDKESTLIYIIGSGLSDRGLLNFADNDFLNNEIEAEDIAEAVSEKIKDDDELEDLTIVWDGVGRTVAPQENLDNDASDKVTAIYTEVLKELGMSKDKIKFKHKLTSAESATTDYIVKTTKVHVADGHYVFSADETLAFQFHGGTADFINRAETINKVQEIISKHPTDNFEIISYMAKGICGNKALEQDLLAKRLAAVKNLFLENNVSEERITTISGGFGGENECPNGTHDSEAAQRNRKVEINIK